MKRQGSNKAVPLSSATPGRYAYQPPTSYPQPTHNPATSAQPINSHIQSVPKVAIPRLRRQSEGQASSKAPSSIDKNRVAHACEPCRHRKTKCSGERPVCQHCQDFRLPCVYADGKRDRTRKQLGTLSGRVDEYQSLLEDLCSRVGEDDQQRIRKALERDQLSDDEDDSPQTTRNSPERERPSRKEAGEDKVSARVGSTESLDRISEDISRDPESRATGFHGKNSELTWMQRLQKQASYGSDESEENEKTNPDGQDSPTYQTHHVDSGLGSIAASSYHCDDLDIFVPEDEVNPLGLPPRPVADALFKSYMETVHPTFPIVGKRTFLDQYRKSFAKPDVAKSNQNWLAVLNLIFAIGARYSHLIQADWRGNENDHLIYFTRARLLGFKADAVLGHAELQKIQITGLMAFYLLATNQITRAWSISGVALRHACTLGLNLRNESKDVPESSQEIRYRVWWAICSIERVLTVMTGRPTSFAETDCTASLPLPIEETNFPGSNVQRLQDIHSMHRSSSQGSRKSDYSLPTPPSTTRSAKMRSSPGESFSPTSSQSSSQPKQPQYPPCDSLAFMYHTKLSIFTNEVVNSLYRAKAISTSWSTVQDKIADLYARLEAWRTEMPPVFDFTKQHRDQEFSRHRLSLAFFYYSTLIIITRPCLCRIDRKIPDQSDKAKVFNRETATRCVRAARDMLALIPEEPDPIGLFTSAPWWCLVHYLMQGGTILMLELSFRADHMPKEADDVFDSANKALEWLQSMSKYDEAARRAAKLCHQALRGVAPRVGRNPNEVFEMAANALGLRQDTQSVQGMQQSQPPPSGPIAYQPQYGYPTSMALQPSAYTTYDEFVYNTIPVAPAYAPYDELYPTASEMEGMSFQEHNTSGYYQGHGDNLIWYPDAGS